MGLKMESIQEAAEESARRETDAAQEVREEDYPFSVARRRRNLARQRYAALHSRRDAARFPRPLDVGLRDDGALPGSLPLELELAGGGGGLVHGRGLSLTFTSHGGGNASCC